MLQGHGFAVADGGSRGSGGAGNFHQRHGLEVAAARPRLQAQLLELRHQVARGFFLARRKRPPALKRVGGQHLGVLPDECGRNAIGRRGHAGRVSGRGCG